MIYFNKKGQRISHYWWARLMDMGPRYWSVNITLVLGGYVRTTWLGLAHESDVLPSVFATSVIIHGQKDRIVFSPNIGAALSTHRVMTEVARAAA